MSQASSLLSSLAATTTTSTTVATSPIHDYLVVDAEGRIVNVPSTEILFGVETDLDSERKYFQCPRYVGDDIDLTSLGLRIHYRNAQGDEDGYIVTDVKVSGEYITFSWLLGGKLLKTKGTVYFTICAISVDEEGYETCKWNTTLASGTVLEGLDVTLSSFEYITASDLLQQLLDLLNTRSDEAVQAVTDEGVEQIANVEAAGSEQRTLIESKGAETLATIPEDYTSTYNASDEAIRKKACAILMKDKGTVISVSDASDDYVRGLKVFGKTEQFTTTGKNLLNVSVDNSVTIDGYANFNITDDVINITNTALFGFKMPVTFGTTYSASFSKLIVDGVFHFRIYEYSAEPSSMNTSGDTYISTPINTSCASVNRVEKQYTPSAENVTWIAIGFYTSVTNTVSNFQVEIGDAATDYEPYTGGIASPNPEYPQELDSIENAKIKVFSKNLVQNTLGTTTVSNVTYTLNDDGSVTINGTTTKETYYTFDFHNEIPIHNRDLIASYEGNNGLTTLVIGYFNEDGTAVNSIASVNSNEKTFQYPDNAAETRTFIALSANITFDNLVVRPMIRLVGDDDTFDYAEVQSLSITQSLPGLPVSSDGNYTDSNGQQWICDEVDFERNVYIQRVKKIVLDGSDGEWPINSYNYNALGVYIFGYNVSDTILDVYDNPLLCDKLQRQAWGNLTANNRNKIYSTPNYLQIFLEDQSITTSEEFIEWLSNNPITVMYPLGTPIETELTADEFNVFKVLHTNYPNTVIMNDNNATMHIEYNADTKTFILRNGGGGGTTVTKITLSLTASNWIVSSDGTHYTQSTGISVDDNVQVDPQLTATQLIGLINDGISMFLSNENGYIVAYAVGNKPSSDMTIQATETVVIYV